MDILRLSNVVILLAEGVGKSVLDGMQQLITKNRN